MRLLADENVPLACVHALREVGHNVAFILELDPGHPDESVRAVARAQQRILVTFDSDFGRLLFQKGEPPPSGVVYLWFHPVVAAEAAQVVLDLLESYGDSLIDAYTTVRRDRVRQRPLP